MKQINEVSLRQVTGGWSFSGAKNFQSGSSGSVENGKISMNCQGGDTVLMSTLSDGTIVGQCVGVDGNVTAEVRSGADGSVSSATGDGAER